MSEGKAEREKWRRSPCCSNVDSTLSIVSLLAVSLIPKLSVSGPLAPLERQPMIDGIVRMRCLQNEKKGDASTDLALDALFHFISQLDSEHI